MNPVEVRDVRGIKTEDVDVEEEEDALGTVIRGGRVVVVVVVALDVLAVDTAFGLFPLVSPRFGGIVLPGRESMFIFCAV